MEKRQTLTNVFWVSLLIAAIFILWGTLLPGNVETVLGAVDGFISTNFGWFYLLSMTLFVLFALFMIISPFGRIKLGKPEEKPQSYYSYIAVLKTNVGHGSKYWALHHKLDVTGDTYETSGSSLILVLDENTEKGRIPLDPPFDQRTVAPSSL